MFSPRVLRFVLCSLDLEVLRAQRIMDFFILVTHKLTRSKNSITSYNFQELICCQILYSNATGIKLGSSTYLFPCLFLFLVFTNCQVLKVRVGRSRGKGPILVKSNLRHCAASVTLNRFLPSRPSYDFISLHRTSALPLSILLVEGAGGICMYHSNSINRDCSVTDFISLTKPMNARHESVSILVNRAKCQNSGTYFNTSRIADTQKKRNAW